jgi:excisionase family DNA binding protein
MSERQSVKEDRLIVPPDTPIWTTDEVAAYLKISPDMVRLEARKGRLPGFQVGSLWRFRRDRIEEWTQRGREDHRKGGQEI